MVQAGNPLIKLRLDHIYNFAHKVFFFSKKFKVLVSILAYLLRSLMAFISLFLIRSFYFSFHLIDLDWTDKNRLRQNIKMSHIMRKPKMWYHFRTGLTQIKLYKHRRWPEAGNLDFESKEIVLSVCVAETKAQISFTVTAKLICAFVFTYAKYVDFLMTLFK